YLAATQPRDLEGSPALTDPGGSQDDRNSVPFLRGRHKGRASGVLGRQLAGQICGSGAFSSCGENGAGAPARTAPGASAARAGRLSTGPPPRARPGGGAARTGRDGLQSAPPSGRPATPRRETSLHRCETLPRPAAAPAAPAGLGRAVSRRAQQSRAALRGPTPHPLKPAHTDARDGLL